MAWKLIKNFSDGHRYFQKDDGDGKIYVADRSGETPSTTADGVMWIDTGRRITTVGTRASLPVKTLQNTPFWTPVNFDEALWVSLHYGVHIETPHGVFAAASVPA